MELANRNDPLSGPFWQAADEGRLAMPWCGHCERAVWYPQPACPDCGAEPAWRTLSGRARLLAWTVVRKPVNPMFLPEYVPALVVPEEAPGARLVTQLVDCAPEDLQCDMPLVADFRTLSPRGGEPYVAPVFRPA